jgi:hypothetical protein
LIGPIDGAINNIATPDGDQMTAIEIQLFNTIDCLTLPILLLVKLLIYGAAKNPDNDVCCSVLWSTKDA